MAKQQAVTQVNLHVASLNSLKIPTQWTHGEGRRTRALITEAVRLIFRGTRDGMLRKMSSPVLETRCGDEENEGEAAFVAGLAVAFKNKSADHRRLEEGACPAVKNIGKPCAAKPHARFDEGKLVYDHPG